MKRFLPLLLAFALTLALVTPALAAGKKNMPFTLVGNITAVDVTAKTVTVQVLRGNSLVKPFINQIVTLKTDTTTRFLFTDGTTITAITFADLKVGDPVSASGTLVNNVWIAARITVGAKLDCLK